MAAALLRLFAGVVEFFCTLFGLVLGALILLMCVDIAIRNLRIGSLPWLIELTEYAMYAGTFLAAPWVLRKGSHVRVDALTTALSKRSAIRLEQAVDVVGLAIALVLLYYGTDAVWDAFKSKMVQYKTWNVPEGLLLLAIPIGCLLLSVEFVLRIFRVEGAVGSEIDPAKRASL